MIWLVVALGCHPWPKALFPTRIVLFACILRGVMSWLVEANEGLASCFLDKIRILNKNVPHKGKLYASVQNNGHSRFAWVIAHQPTLIWQGMGVAPGTAEDMYSGQAEAFGILAATIFLSHYISYYCNPIPAMQIQNNIGVVTTLANLQKDTIKHPNNTTANDHDIFLEITTTANNCTGITFQQYLHVQGHQDTKPHHQLTIVNNITSTVIILLSNTLRHNHCPALPMATQSLMQPNPILK